MKRLVVVGLLVACWSSSKKPAEPLGNAATKDAPMGSAKSVTKDNDGGVIELGGDRGTSLDQANTLMAKHCGSEQYQIFQEGEEVVGTSGDKTQTAWRVHYNCTGPLP